MILALCFIITVTTLSKEEADSLRVMLSSNGVNPDEVSLEDSNSTLEQVQQLLVEKGYEDLATTLRAKLNEGLSSVICFC